MGFESIGAIQDCMKSLGLKSSENLTNTVSAKITNNRVRRHSGNADVIFNSNWYSNEGPYIQFGDEIRGFGIRYSTFKPQWLDIKWDAVSMQLTIDHDEYSFTIDFS